MTKSYSVRTSDTTFARVTLDLDSATLTDDINRELAGVTRVISIAQVITNADGSVDLRLNRGVAPFGGTIHLDPIADERNELDARIASAVVIDEYPVEGDAEVALSATLTLPKGAKILKVGVGERAVIYVSGALYEPVLAFERQTGDDLYEIIGDSELERVGIAIIDYTETLIEGAAESVDLDTQEVR